jgi:hypothetical protein
MRGLVLGGAILAIAGTSARADADYENDDDEVVSRYHAWEGGASIAIGDMPYGDFGGGGLGLGVQAGRRFDRLFLFGEYQLLVEHGRIGDELREHRALMNRFSANVRYDVLTTSFERLAPLSLFVEAGVGEELQRWSEGGTLHRPDANAGFGVEFLVPGHTRAYYGITIRLSLVVSHAPAPLDPSPRCGGPCYAPSSPMETDLGALYIMSFPFGR